MPCEEIFPKPYGLKICDEAVIRPTSYQGALIWVMAYYQTYQPPKFVRYNPQIVLMRRIGLNQNFSALTEIMAKSTLRKYLDEIEEDFKTIFSCNTKPCDKEYLAKRQYFTGGVTNISHTKYTSLNYSSIANMPDNQKTLGNKIPEIYSFFKIHFGHEERIFGGTPDKMLGFFKGKDW